MVDTTAEGSITQEALEYLRKIVGIKLRISWINNELACKETIRNFAYGVGDDNPLWRDEQYCKDTRYGCIVAPPSWLYSVFGPGVQHGLPGVHAFHSADTWEFHKPVLIGDKIRPEAIFTGFEERPSQFAGKVVVMFQDRLYYNQRGELVAKGIRQTHRAERRATREKGKYADIELPHPWTDAELKRIDDEILSQEVRGNQPRYWEDVNVGDEVCPLVKGPLGMTDAISFTAGTHLSILPAHEAALHLYQRHPAWGIRDPETHAYEPIVAVHWNVHVANHAGLAYPYDLGIQRNSWLIQLFTNWMGDEGWLKQCSAQYRAFVFISDCVWLRGKVSKKYIDQDGECCVQIDTTAFNQRGENTMPGQGVVVLPSRERQSWALEKRLPVSGIKTETAAGEKDL